MRLNPWEIEISRRHLFDFTLHTKPNFEPNWFHEKYYTKLNDFAHGRIKKLMVFVPPQHGKSEGSTRRLPAYSIGNNPNQKIAIVSYTASKARKFNREIQRVFDDDLYKQIFPHISLSNGADGYGRTFDEFEIVDFEGSVKTVGIEGALTGDPVDLLIMDDLYKDWASAQSPTIREKVQDWYDAVADTRLHNDSRQLIVFTRWHKNDLAGYLLSKERDQWEVVVYPAIKEGRPTDLDPRKQGEALWPERHSIERLERTKKRNPHNFESLYQQNPTPKEGLLWPLEDLQLYDPLKVNFKAEYKYCMIDPADRGGDDLAALACYLVGDKIYVVDAIYNTDGTDLSEPACVSFIKKHKFNHVEVEGNGGWVQFGKNIRKKIENTSTELRIIHSTVNKHTRIQAQSGFVKENMIFREDWQDMPEYKKFMVNLTSYLKIQEGSSKNDHDDAPDCVAGCGAFFQTRFPSLW